MYVKNIASGAISKVVHIYSTSNRVYLEILRDGRIFRDSLSNYKVICPVDREKLNAKVR